MIENNKLNREKLRRVMDEELERILVDNKLKDSAFSKHYSSGYEIKMNWYFFDKNQN